MTLFGLSGFLGSESDWEGIPAVLEPKDLSRLSLDEWARQFNAFARAFAAPRVIMGYSLGGRKALHALLADESLWDSAILVSTHPGLSTDQERKERLIRDKAWGERFMNDKWEDLLADWNNQDVLKSSPPLFRKEKEIYRLSLARDLQAFSLGTQRDLKKEISQLNLPILWVAGENDTKFSEIAKQMTMLHKLSSEWILKEFGHRINFKLIYDVLQDKLPREVKNEHMEKDQRISRHQV